MPHASTLAAVSMLAFLALTPAAATEPVHAIAMHGAPKHPAGFTHFPYVDPDAPKGGRVTLGQLGTFDSLNVHSIK
jgi:peptide/nickel transport system substrate-binding protein